MTITPKMLRALLDRRGIRPDDAAIEGLAADLDAALRVAKAVLAVKAEEAAMHARHQSERGEMMGRLGRARDGCPHPARTSSPGVHPGARRDWTCDLCGQWLIEE